MPYRDTAEYRRKAKECLVRAKATDDVLLEMHFLELADTWKRLAKRTERVESMVGVSAGITKTHWEARPADPRGPCTKPVESPALSGQPEPAR